MNAMAIRGTKYVHKLERRVQTQEEIVVTNDCKKKLTLCACVNEPAVRGIICCQPQIVMGCSFKVNGE